jgi:hypothetical protein
VKAVFAPEAIDDLIAATEQADRRRRRAAFCQSVRAGRVFVVGTRLMDSAGAVHSKLSTSTTTTNFCRCVRRDPFFCLIVSYNSLD